METQLTLTQIQETKLLLKDNIDAQKAIAVLEKHNGRLDTTFDQLWNEKSGIPFYDPNRPSLWEVTIQQLRQEICGDEGFRTQISKYNKNPGTAPLLTGLIVYLVGLTTLPH